VIDAFWGTRGRPVHTQIVLLYRAGFWAPVSVDEVSIIALIRETDSIATDVNTGLIHKLKAIFANAYSSRDQLKFQIYITKIANRDIRLVNASNAADFIYADGRSHEVLFEGTDTRAIDQLIERAVIAALAGMCCRIGELTFWAWAHALIRGEKIGFAWGTISLSTGQAVHLKWLARDAGVRNSSFSISIFALLDAKPG
jgi:hypothetical protein